VLGQAPIPDSHQPWWRSIHLEKKRERGDKVDLGAGGAVQLVGQGGVGGTGSGRHGEPHPVHETPEALGL